MKYFRLWENEEQHIAYTGSSEYVEPYVGYIPSTRQAFYNRKPLSGLSVGDIVYNGLFVSKQIDTTKTPVGVVVIPSDFLPDGKARILSLNTITSATTSGSSGSAAIQWTSVASSTTLSYYQRVPTIDTDAIGNYDSSTIGFNSWSRLPSDISTWTGPENFVDQGTRWYTTTDTHAPSPFMKNAAGEEILCPQYIWDTGTGNAKNALTDFDGLANTAILKNAKVEGTDNPLYPAAYHCSIYQPIGDETIAKRENNGWYLPACGEAAFMIPRFTKINEVLGKIKAAYPSMSVSLLSSTNYWTSTEYTSLSARSVHTYNGYVSNATKTLSYYVRAFAVV